jgi:redox-sensitive bicupin YhaK (pirin superfamily)
MTARALRRGAQPKQENRMIILRKAADRGHAEHGWLDSWHSFSFADYMDPAHMGFGNLRVLNDDTVAPGTGFGTHGHRDMEIVSYVLDGALAHQDSMGNGSASGSNAGVIRPGDVQRMTAGTGVRHSEFNHSKDSATHFLQIWLLPDRLGLAPGYEQINVPEARKRGALTLIAAPDATTGAVKLNADARILAGLFDGAERQELALPAGRLAYVHVARGSLVVNGQPLAAGDAAKLRGEERLVLEGGKDAEVLVFDLAP